MTKITYKVTPSLLEQWRCVRLGLWKMTSHKFVKNLQSKQPTTLPQSKGKAYHKLLEHGGGKYEFPQAGKMFYRIPCKDLRIDWVFSEKAALPAIKLHQSLIGIEKPYLFETPHKVRFDFESHFVDLSMRFDLTVGLYLHEFKTMSARPSYEYYNDLIQWKCYLLAMPQLQGMRYHFFRLNDDCTDCEYSYFDNMRPNTEELYYLVVREIKDMLDYLLISSPEVLALLEVKEQPEPLTGIESL